MYPRSHLRSFVCVCVEVDICFLFEGKPIVYLERYPHRFTTQFVYSNVHWYNGLGGGRFLWSITLSMQIETGNLYCTSTFSSWYSDVMCFSHVVTSTIFSMFPLKWSLNWIGIEVPNWDLQQKSPKVSKIKRKIKISAIQLLKYEILCKNYIIMILSTKLIPRLHFHYSNPKQSTI